MTIWALVLFRILSRLFFSDLKDFIKLLERAVTAGDARMVVRPVRGLGYVRKNLTVSVLRQIIRGICLNKEDKAVFSQYIGEVR